MGREQRFATILGLAFLGGALGLWAWSDPKEPTQGQRKASPVRATTVEAATTTRSVRFSGVTRAARRAERIMAPLLIDGASDGTLWMRRSESVKAYLVQHGISASRLSVQGFGESRPVATNETAEGRQQNRRVELNQK